MSSFNQQLKRTRILPAFAFAVLVLWMPLAAQLSLDRTKIPPAAKPPVLRVPTWTKSKLSNGADLVVSEKHDLPLVSLTITFLGGSNQFEPADRAGLAGMVAV